MRWIRASSARFGVKMTPGGGYIQFWWISWTVFGKTSAHYSPCKYKDLIRDDSLDAKGLCCNANNQEKCEIQCGISHDATIGVSGIHQANFKKSYLFCSVAITVLGKMWGGQFIRNKHHTLWCWVHHPLDQHEWECGILRVEDRHKKVKQEIQERLL